MPIQVNRNSFELYLVNNLMIVVFFLILAISNGVLKNVLKLFFTKYFVFRNQSFVNPYLYKDLLNIDLSSALICLNNIDGVDTALLCILGLTLYLSSNEINEMGSSSLFGLLGSDPCSRSNLIISGRFFLTAQHTG